MAKSINYSGQSTSLIGESPAFLGLLEQVSQVAPMNKPVLVIGARGTGKELIGARLHYLSGRWGEPLLKLNCATLTESLLETELFGHEAGAFTGATRRHVGRLERADGGTLFLDELASVSLRVQEKILRAVEYGEFERVGGSETLRVDVRLVGATNADLPHLVAIGKFRADLLDRLAFDVLTVPPLTARAGDILTLAEHFALGITRELSRDYFAGFSENARRELLKYSWPGNVRELKNVVERSVYRWQAPEMPVNDIVFDPFESPFRPQFHEKDAQKEKVVSAAPSSQGALPFDLKATLREVEISSIERALSAARYNQSQAAQLLGLTYHQLRGAMRKYAISVRMPEKGLSERTSNHRS